MKEGRGVRRKPPWREKEREKERKVVSVVFNTLTVDSMLLSRDERLTLCHFDPFMVQTYRKLVFVNEHKNSSLPTLGVTPKNIIS